jgi:hypothetical protein
VTGPTGAAGGGLASGACWADYLYWNNLTSAWTPGNNTIRQGCLAGQTNQATLAIAIGRLAGNINQSTNAIAIGQSAGQTNQGQNAIAIGLQAGQGTQQTGAIAIGFQAGQTSQAIYAVAIGNEAGQGTQQTYAVAIGYQAGQTGQSDYGIAIGYQAGQNNQATNSIVLNAQNVALNTSGSDRTHIAPIRENYKDSILVYDDQNYNDPGSLGTDQRFEVSYAPYAVPLFTWYPPESVGSYQLWNSQAFMAITERLPYTTGIYCQNNSYEYWIVDCSTFQAVHTTPILGPGTPCRTIQGYKVTYCPRAYFAVAVDPNLGYKETCYFNSYWWAGNGSPVEFIEQEWSATIGWLQDRRSRINFTDANGNPLEGRVLLLGANHTV